MHGSAPSGSTFRYATSLGPEVSERPARGHTQMSVTESDWNPWLLTPGPHAAILGKYIVPCGNCPVWQLSTL